MLLILSRIWTNEIQHHRHQDHHDHQDHHHQGHHDHQDHHSRSIRSGHPPQGWDRPQAQGREEPPRRRTWSSIVIKDYHNYHDHDNKFDNCHRDQELLHHSLTWIPSLISILTSSVAIYLEICRQWQDITFSSFPSSHSRDSSRIDIRSSRSEGQRWHRLQQWLLSSYGPSRRRDSRSGQVHSSHSNLVHSMGALEIKHSWVTSKKEQDWNPSYEILRERGRAFSPTELFIS